MYLAITAFYPGSWGRAEDEKTAVRYMRNNYRSDFGRSRKVEDFNVYQAGLSTTVNEMGGLNYKPAEGAPKLVRRVRKGKDVALEE